METPQSVITIGINLSCSFKQYFSLYNYIILSTVWAIGVDTLASAVVALFFKMQIRNSFPPYCSE